MFRPLALKISRHVWFWRRLPARYGRRSALVSPSSHLSYWMHSLEQPHGELFGGVDLVVRKGNCVWDIGANMGVVSLAAASIAGPDGYVLGVEADLSLVPSLRRSALRDSAGCAPIEILPVALSESVGVARFNISSLGSATNSLAGFGRMGDAMRTELVPTVTLDWLLGHFRAPDVVKIDVEGAEMLVLNGGRKVLAEHRPLLIIEVGADTSGPMAQLLKEYDYVPYKMHEPTGPRLPLQVVTGDVIAIPKGRDLPWATASNGSKAASAGVPQSNQLAPELAAR